jgi:hypothetical protein
MNLLKEYSDKHPTLRQIIIADNASKDQTIASVMKWIYEHKDGRFNLITQPNKIDEKKMLITSLEQVTTQTTIILEPELHTRLHQIRRQILLLKKADLCLPNRFHRLSITNYKPEIGQKAIENILNLFGMKQKYPDINNPQKSFRTKKILEALKKNKSTKQLTIVWLEIIKENPSLKISQCQTHWKN